MTALTVAAFELAGHPHVGKPVSYGSDALCGICRRVTDVAPAGRVLSPSFGSWGDVAADEDGKRWLCAACTYAFRAPDLRLKPTILTPGPPATLVHPDPAALARHLLRPLGQSAVILPLTRKRVVAPRASWGTLTTDYESISWTKALSRILLAALRLRRLGFGPGSLAEPSAPLNLLRRHPTHEHDTIRDLWHVLDPVRGDKARLPLFQRLSDGAR